MVTSGGTCAASAQTRRLHAALLPTPSGSRAAASANCGAKATGSRAILTINRSLVVIGRKIGRKAARNSSRGSAAKPATNRS